jgi:hypothetical protein
VHAWGTKYNNFLNNNTSTWKAFIIRGKTNWLKKGTTLEHKYGQKILEKTTLDILFTELKLREIMIQIQYNNIIKKGNVIAGDKTPSCLFVSLMKGLLEM